MPFGCQTFYLLNRELLIRYSRHGLNTDNWMNELFLDHLNTELVCYSDSRTVLLFTSSSQEKEVLLRPPAQSDQGKSVLSLVRVARIFGPDFVQC